MGKRSTEPIVVRQSFSHARTTPIVVEKVKRRTGAPTDGKAVLRCPSCRGKMKLVRIAPTPGGLPKLTACCPDCSGGTIKDDEK
jgi:hypothetical protein